MHSRPAPFHAAEPTAAALLDMKPAEFRKLVADGHLPKGREIAPGVIRWPVADLIRIGSGEAAKPDGGIEL